ncbi:hypothetical protein Syun_024275 [Stephania yunnanensis]|uniref:Uncharacterized protein n=1 Tax=Stephania yunnanensis TaxID=152371 RepID=A0AAP0NIH5_9MAGN
MANGGHHNTVLITGVGRGLGITLAIEMARLDLLQYEEARPLLDWICFSIRSSNVLFPTDLSFRRDNQEAVFGAEEGLKEIRIFELWLKFDLDRVVRGFVQTIWKISIASVGIEHSFRA